jgi:hypothetical protein
MRLITTSSEEIGTSVIGAGILGFGLGILIYSFFEGLAWLMIIVGAVIHSIGMYLIHRGRHDKKLRIGDIFYWLCWIILIIIFFIFIWRYF